MTTVLALAAIAIAVALSVVRSVQERRLRKRLDDRDRAVDQTFGDLRVTLRDLTQDVDQIYTWAQEFVDAETQQPTDQPVIDPPADAILEPALEQPDDDAEPAQDLDLGEPVEVFDAPPAYPPTTEIPRAGAHRTDARATRAAGRALREGADEESTR